MADVSLCSGDNHHAKRRIMWKGAYKQETGRCSGVVYILHTPVTLLWIGNSMMSCPFPVLVLFPVY